MASSDWLTSKRAGRAREPIRALSAYSALFEVNQSELAICVPTNER